MRKVAIRFERGRHVHLWKKTSSTHLWNSLEILRDSITHTDSKPPSQGEALPQSLPYFCRGVAFKLRRKWPLYGFHQSSDGYAERHITNDELVCVAKITPKDWISQSSLAICLDQAWLLLLGFIRVTRLTLVVEKTLYFPPCIRLPS